MRVLLILLLIFLLLSGTGIAETLLIDDFDQGLRAGWQEKSFSGHTRYRVVAEGGGQVLQADSRDAASGLVYEIKADPRQLPILSWRWKVAGTVPGGDERSKQGDDYAARIYVIFPHWFFPKTKTLNYIWANRLPQGEHIPNPFTGNAIMLAVESGPGQAGEWISERRNVFQDYRQVFGNDPPTIGAIAIMTDTDNTGSTATAWYDDIRLSSE